MQWNNEELDDYQERELKNAQTLAESLRPFVDGVRVEKGENRGDFYAVLTRGGVEYIARKNYQGYIIISGEYCHNRYLFPLVSSHERGKVYTKYKLNNLKVPSQKKITAELDAIDNEKKELEAKQAEAERKEAEFLASLAGFDVKFSYDWNNAETENGEYTKIRGKIIGGEIIKHGLVFSFEIGQDGYISKKISVHYSVENTLEAFKELIH